MEHGIEKAGRTKAPKTTPSRSEGWRHEEKGDRDKEGRQEGEGIQEARKAEAQARGSSAASAPTPAEHWLSRELSPLGGQAREQIPCVKSASTELFEQAPASVTSLKRYRCEENATDGQERHLLLAPWLA